MKKLAEKLLYIQVDKKTTISRGDTAAFQMAHDTGGNIGVIQSESKETAPINVFRTVMEEIPRCKDVKQLYEHVYERYRLPVILTDISYHLLAYGGPRPCEDIYWETIIETGKALPETIIDGYYKDGYMDRLSSHPEPFKVDWGISKEMPQTTCGVFVDNKPEGITSVLYTDKSNEQIALELNAALRTAAEIYMVGRKGQECGGPERTFMAKVLLDDCSSPLTLLKNAAFFKDEHITPNYLVLAIRLRKSVSGRLQNLRSSIIARFPWVVYSNREDFTLLFFRGIKDRHAVESILRALEQDAEGKADYVCGVSDIFDDLETRGAYVEQAILSMDYGMRQPLGKHHFMYSECYAAIVMINGTDNLMRENRLCAELKNLIDADRKNSTNFYESLRCYLFSLGDMSETASQLFLHRNSAMYRIKRCQEIMGVDLSDQEIFERLYISCKVNEDPKYNFNKE